MSADETDKNMQKKDKTTAPVIFREKSEITKKFGGVKKVS